MQYKIHNADLISFDLLDDKMDIDINELDSLFDKCVECSSHIYFRGDRPFLKNAEMDLLMNSYTLIYPSEGLSGSIYKVGSNTLTDSRKEFNKIWSSYEYPFLFFIDDEEFNDNNANLLAEGYYIDVIIKRLRNALVLYRPGELSMLFLAKSIGATFPHF